MTETYVGRKQRIRTAKAEYGISSKQLYNLGSIEFFERMSPEARAILGRIASASRKKPHDQHADHSTDSGIPVR